MNYDSAFLNPQLTPANLDRYIIRSRILQAIQQVLPELSGTLLDVGCGQMPYKPLLLSHDSKVEKYIGLDLQGGRHAQLLQPDLLWDGQTIPLDDASIDCAIATEVFEHCPELEVVLKEIWRVLKPGGILFFTVPFLWNLHEVPYDEYRYTPFSLQRHLKNSGFSTIEIKALGGWDASLAIILGLWTRRRYLKKGKISKMLKLIFSYLLLPIVYILNVCDRSPKDFQEGTMMTGLRCLCREKGV